MSAVAGVSVDDFIKKLSAMEFNASFSHALNIVLNELGAATSSDMPESNIQKHMEYINASVSNDTLADTVDAISAWKDSEDKWLSRAAKTLIKGSPITQRLVWEQLRRGKELSLEQCFQMELIMACRCASTGEFQEGVRALLVEKDGAPKWLYESHQSVPDDFLETFFTNQWDHETHPLSRLIEKNLGVN
jgi:hypothetical protein